MSTIFVTNKIATENWIFNNGNRRKEALPHWCYSRGVVYDDGLYLPTKENPLIDGITGATPKSDKELKLNINDLSSQIFVIKAEFNHSIDFNNFYPKNANIDDINYSGGEFGSGQPAVVYADTINLSGYPNYKLQIIGHSSCNGSDGLIYNTLENLSSAQNIVKQIKIIITK